MSAICGVIDVNKQGRADGALVRRMVDALRHRGSDGEGFYDSPDVALGAARQAIIDLRGSKQPLYNEERSIALIFDGEIFNYRELREDLKRRNHVLQSDGDGEVIIHLYEAYGLTLFSHLRGMYAFALWDTNAERLVLAVDHVGMKPLYLHERDGKLLFTSEAKALFADPATPRKLNREAADTYLSFGYMPDEQTLFEGVRRLPAGHALVVEKGQSPRLHPFWQFPSPPNKNDSARRASNESVLITEMRNLLTESVHLHLRSDVPLGLLLDDGLNSAGLLALTAHESNRALSTFSLGYEGHADTATQQIAEHFKTDHHHRTITAADWWAGFEKTIYHLDEPLASVSAVENLLLAEATQGVVKTVLTGLGGDELFGGAPAQRAIPAMIAARKSAYMDSAPLQTLLSGKEKAVTSARANSVSREEALARLKPLTDAVFNDALRQNLYADLPNGSANMALKMLLDKSWRADPYDLAQALVFNGALAANNLLALDKTTMAATLEARAPFLDPVLLKFVVNVPAAIRMKAPNYLLREAVRPYLPASMLETAPSINPSPVANWLDNELGDNVRAILLNPNAFITELFNRPALETLLKDHFWGRTRQPDAVFRLLVLEMWAQRFLKPVTFTL